MEVSLLVETMNSAHFDQYAALDSIHDISGEVEANQYALCVGRCASSWIRSKNAELWVEDLRWYSSEALNPNAIESLAEGLPFHHQTLNKISNCLSSHDLDTISKLLHERSDAGIDQIKDKLFEMLPLSGDRWISTMFAYGM